MKLASTFMHGSGPSPKQALYPNGLPAPHASALAGDLNAFAPEDRTAPVEAGLQDAFLVLGGKEDTEEGYTWGQQVPEETRRRFGCSRMDKVLFCGGLQVNSLERIGAEVTVKIRVEFEFEEEEEDEDDDKDEEVWVTDHLGLMADFTIVDNHQAQG
ncbi:hypothetical protein VTN77DRAFT_8670 [Rasamsonia byssochlamydoides]|uniref:uncharacterized protein n=1 Tax=Rasamsonia byssochlamydoides TaxID=89139 RepID=UPI003741F85B